MVEAPRSNPQPAGGPLSRVVSGPIVEARFFIDVHRAGLASEARYREVLRLYLHGIDPGPRRTAVATIVSNIFMNSPHRRWYLAQTQPRAETRANLHLSRQQFETYLPVYLKTRRHARRVETIVAPLYPGYIFIAIDLGLQRWRAIQSTIGVSRIVSHGDQPAPVPDGVVEELQRRQDDGGYIRLERRARFNRGDKVRVAGGVFSEFLGLYEGIDERERVAILLDMLGRKVRVVLPLGLVDAA